MQNAVIIKIRERYVCNKLIFKYLHICTSYLQLSRCSIIFNKLPIINMQLRNSVVDKNNKIKL